MNQVEAFCMCVSCKVAINADECYFILVFLELILDCEVKKIKVQKLKDCTETIWMNDARNQSPVYQYDPWILSGFFFGRSFEDAFDFYSSRSLMIFFAFWLKTLP